MTKIQTLKNTKAKRYLSFLLTLVMAFSIIMGTHATAFAANACNPGSNYLGTFTFTGQNAGAYYTINGTKARICVAYKAVDNNYAFSLGLNVYEYGGRNVFRINLYNHGEKDSDGYYFFVSDYFSVNKGVDYRITYDAFTQGAVGEQRRLKCHVWYDVLA
ncbi:MAG: hypothetical protein ACI4VO_02130 [Clostridia bacterium]